MEKRGHEIKVTARDKDVTKQLLDVYNIPYTLIGKPKKGKFNLIKEWILRDIQITKIAREFQPDILMGNLNPAIAHAAKIIRKKSIIFTDQEPEALNFPLADMLTIPFADVIITLSSVRHDYGKKEIRVNSFKELAYLHPNWFKPDESVLDSIDPEKRDNFAILRFVSWDAYHDVGEGGFDLESKSKLVSELQKYTNVFISSESPLPEEFESYHFPVSPEKMHDLLYFARLLVCDSQTMATEAAILGTPVVRCNSFVGDNDMSNFINLEKKYQMIFNIQKSQQAIIKAIDIISVKSGKNEGIQENRIINEKCDLTSFFIDVIEDKKQEWWLINVA